jgi:glucokinase
MGKVGSFIGVDLGGTNMRAAKVTDGVIVKQQIMPTPRKAKNCEDTIEALINVIAEVMDADVLAIGIGVPSVVDRRLGIVYNVANIPYWEEVHLKDILTSRFSVPVYVDNDANCFALGERFFGEGQTIPNFVGLTLGTGLGGGIIQQGKLLDDANCGSGEFGEIPYKEHNLEYYCSGSYFMNEWHINGKEMHERAMQNDPIALEAYSQLGLHLSVAVKIVVLTLDPQLIVFGGSVAEAHSLFEASLKEGLKDFPYPNSINRLQIRYSNLQNAGILGAASLCY